MATVASGLDERRWPWPGVALAWPARLRSVSGIVALDAVVIGGLMVVALVSRLLALRWGAGLNSDEAVPGLMAMHVAAGTDWPVFYWGQHYFGSLEA